MIELLMQVLPAFLLVLSRVTAFFVTVPIFSMRGVPAQFKVGIAFFVSLFTVLSMNVEPVPMDGIYIMTVIREVLIGILLGFVAYLIFTVTQIAGSFVDMQMGFGIANVVDPMTGAQSPILGNLKFFLAVLTFLAIDGHHYLLMGIMNSYDWVPLDNEFFTRIYEGSVSTFLLRTLSTMFVLAFQLSAPLITALFLVDVALGMLARTAPQFNVFVIGLPLKILVGYIVYLVMIPGFLFLFQQLFSHLFAALNEMLVTLQG
ncbi:flagellar biosynthetic protein FliR [Insulibacter thermoxylanivorax]|uniref:Flagellar biosynthetic protein FliR n=1 Tax=Insulibacter thermoxylanivorax TaxID=2749268 RepID=A0A916VGQ6_9BACL|nr:flagellar biosynthetic protein FliR [Insulibacter thermoxylanivorax]